MKKLKMLFGLLFFVAIQPLFATDYTVTTTDGGNWSSGTNEGTLRWCIDQASWNTGPHTIRFNIPTASASVDGKYIINTGTISINAGQTITIDATTQTGYACKAPVVVLRGTGSGQGFNLSNASGTFHIKGFIIQNFQRGVEAQQCRGSVKACWIGLNNAGTDKYNTSFTEYGVYLHSGANNFTIGGPNCDRNVISGVLNSTTVPGAYLGAIYVTLDNTDRTILIENNFIGTDKTGKVRIGNGNLYPLREHGIRLTSAPSTIIRGNVISGNNGNGIWATSCNNIAIRGNIIGLDSSGMAELTAIGGGTATVSNGGAGIMIESTTGGTIGGTTASERNIISANGGAVDSRPCGQRTYEAYCDPLYSARGWPANEPCRELCPDKYDATLQTGVYLFHSNTITISGNYVGTDATGNSSGTSMAFSNLYAGVKIEGTSSGNIIGGATSASRNIISGNGYDLTSTRTGTVEEYLGHGIQLNNATVVSTTIRNNYIGVGADGSTPLGNRQDGISLLGSKNNTIADNVISSNAYGIFMQSDFGGTGLANQVSGNTITGNKIGTDATGTIKLGNGNRSGLITDTDGGGIGIQHGSYNNTVGGTTAGAGNIISGNRLGIVLRNQGFGGPANLNTFQGNYIGVDITGNAALANDTYGVFITEGAINNTFGGTTSAAGNVISSNAGHGIYSLNGDNNKFFFNKIGIFANGNAAGNTGDGIHLFTAGTGAADGSTGNIIGHTAQPNTIAYNTGNGITVNGTNTINNSIHTNSIFCNSLMGIDLVSGGNSNLAAPTGEGNSSEIIWSHALAGKYIEVFEAGPCRNCVSGTPTNGLQGRTFVAAGTAPFTFAAAQGYDPAKTYTATASDLAPDNTTGHNTSEFSVCALLCVPPATVSISTSDPTTICAGQTFPILTATAEAGGTTPYRYMWYNGATRVDSSTTGTYQTAAAGTYTVVVVAGDGSCSTTSGNSISVVVNPLPTVSLAASSTTICDGQSTTLTATGSGGSGTLTYNWTSSPTSAPKPTGASGSVSPTAAQSPVTYTVTVTDANNCTSVSDNEIITINPTPVVSVASSATTICGGQSATLTATGSGGTGSLTYNWVSDPTSAPKPTGSSGSVSPAATESPVTYTVTVTDANNCTSATDSEVITVNPTPAVSLAASSKTICDGQSTTLTATGSGGTGSLTYNWVSDPTSAPKPTGSSGSVSPTVAMSPVTYTVTVTDANSCTSASDNEIITINPTPVVSVSSDATTICGGQSATLTATGSGGSGTLTYNWVSNPTSAPKPTGATGSVSPTAAESPVTYTVTVTDANNCTSATDSEVITVNPTPTVSLAASSTTICEGQSTTLTATGSGGTGVLQYNWTSNPSTAVKPSGASGTVTPTLAQSPVTYTVTVTDENTCTSASDSEIITVNPTATVQVDAESKTICDGQSVTLSATGTGGTGTLTYTWVANPAGAPVPAGASGDVSPTAAQSPVIYSVTVTDENNCTSASDTTVVTINSTPAVTLNADANVICDSDALALTAAGSGGTGSYTYNWTSDPATAPKPTGASGTVDPDTGTATYTVTVTDGNSCTSASASETITINENPPLVINPDGNFTICNGASTDIVANTTATNVSFTWYYNDVANGNTTNTQSASVAGEYKVVVVDNLTSCSTQDSATLNVETTDFATVVSSTDEFCEGDTLVLEATPTNGEFYQWYHNDLIILLNGNSNTYNATAAGNYKVEVHLPASVGGCKDTSANKEIFMNTNPSTQAFASQPEICIGDPVTISAVPSGGVAPYTYGWTSSQTDSAFTVSPTATTTYSVVVTDSKGCSSATADTMVVVNELPEVSPSADSQVICDGQSTTLHATVTGGTPTYTYAWTSGGLPATTLDDPSSSDPVATPSSPTSYGIEVTDSKGCASGRVSMTVTVNPLPAVTASASETTVCDGSSVTLSAVASGGTPDYAYLWTGPGLSLASAQNPVATPPVGTNTYTVTVTDAKNCSIVSADVTVTVDPNPETFTLNANGATIFCDGDSVVLAVSPETAGVSYEWTHNSVVVAPNSATYTAKLEGAYTVTATNSFSCSTDADTTINVLINDNPDSFTLVSSGPPVICEGDSVTLEVSPIRSGITYDWYETASNVVVAANSPVYVAKVSGIYTVTATNSFLCSTNADTSIAVVVDSVPPVPQMNLAADTFFCSSDSIELSVVAPVAEETYEWINTDTRQIVGTGTPVYVKESGSYTLIASYATSCGTKANDTVYIEKRNNPVPITLTPHGENAICELDSLTITVAAKNSGDVIGSGATYEWRDIDTDVIVGTGPSYIAKDSGTFTVRIISNNTCFTDADTSVTVKINSNPETKGLVANGATIFCEGGSVSLTVSDADPAVRYSWINLSISDTVERDSPTYVADTSGKYTVIASYTETACFTWTEDTINVTENFAPEAFGIKLDGPNPFCEGGSVNLSPTVVESGVRYDWYEVGQSGILRTDTLYNADRTGFFTVIGTFPATQCSTASNDTVNVIENPRPDVIITTDNISDVICEGEPVELAAIVSHTNLDDVTLLWDPTGETSDTIIIGGVSQLYTVTATDTVTGCTGTASIDLPVMQVTATINNGDTLAFCNLSGDYIDATVGSTSGNHTYTWTVSNDPALFTEDTTDAVNPEDLILTGIAAGEEYYILHVVDNISGCDKMDSILVIVNPLPVVSLASNKDSVCANTEIQLTASANGGTPDYVFGWSKYNPSTGDNSPIFNDMVADTSVSNGADISSYTGYIVVVADSNGCMALDSLEIYTYEEQVLTIPNLITPNDDKHNDVLVIKDEFSRDVLPGASIQIFNRWGQAVYKNSSYDNEKAWGASNCTDGVYYYLLNAGCGDEEYKGWIHIISNVNN